MEELAILGNRFVLGGWGEFFLVWIVLDFLLDLVVIEDRIELFLVLLVIFLGRLLIIFEVEVVVILVKGIR